MVVSGVEFSVDLQILVVYLRHVAIDEDVVYENSMRFASQSVNSTHDTTTITNSHNDSC